jgi:hypothetical protein
MLLFRLPEPHSGFHPVGIRRSNLQRGLALLPEPQLLGFNFNKELASVGKKRADSNKVAANM